MYFDQMIRSWNFLPAMSFRNILAILLINLLFDQLALFFKNLLTFTFMGDSTFSFWNIFAPFFHFSCVDSSTLIFINRFAFILVPEKIYFVMLRWVFKFVYSSERYCCCILTIHLKVTWFFFVVLFSLGACEKLISTEQKNYLSPMC